MKKIKDLKVLRLALVGAMIALITFTSCKKEDPPTPQEQPAFVGAVIFDGLGNFDVVLNCTSHDVELIGLDVTAPAGIGTDNYSLGGIILTRSTPVPLGLWYGIINGTWTLTVRGNLKSGVDSGSSFTATVSVPVS